MKVFKVIIKVLLVIIFILSISLNAFVFRSSYGTLLFKYNSNKFSSMVNSRALEFNSIHFLDKSNEGIQIHLETINKGVLEVAYFDFYFDKGSNMTAKFTEIDSAVKKITTYYTTNYLYKEVDGVKTKIAADEITIVNGILNSLIAYQGVLSSDIKTNENKAKINFSFSPFYFLGLKYEIKDELSFHYDLDGRLRKVKVVLADGTVEKYTISYKNNQIKLPNLDRYS